MFKGGKDLKTIIKISRNVMRGRGRYKTRGYAV